MVEQTQDTRTATPQRSPLLEVLTVFARLGLTSFGGPVAHLGYYRSELVERRGWVDDQTYADIIGLCQFLPGPASSQVAIALGVVRAGLAGGLAAWIGFTLPSAVLMILAAYSVALLGGAHIEWLHGLLVVAVAVVAQAVWGMARTLCPDRARATIAIAAAVAVLLWTTGIAQVLVIACAGVIGWRFLRTDVSAPTTTLRVPISRWFAVCCWIAFFGLLLGLPFARQVIHSQALALFDSFYRSGALVFGGGHVVLPLIQVEVVPPGWVTNAQFIAGYGLAQAMPGPLFTFAAYVGTIEQPAPNGWLGGLIALIGIFLPAWLLILGSMPFWDRLRVRADAQGALRGVNAAVVGVLGAALYTPIWISAIRQPVDLALALVCFGLLAFWKLPAWLVVLIGGGLGAAISI